MDLQKVSGGYKRLRIIEEATKLVKMIYSVTGRFPPNERFGLTSQLRRAAVSIPTNIIEGHVRGGRKEFLQFLLIANGSAVEVEYLLYLSHELGFLTGTIYEDIENQRKKVAVYLNKLIGSVRLQTQQVT